MQEITANKPIENWTKFPNNILDNLDKFTPKEIIVFCLMVRKTIGYSNPNYEFSISYISKKTGLSRPTVIKATNGLLNKKTIKKLPSGTRSISKFNVIWTTSKKDLLVNIDDQSNNFTCTSKKDLPELVKNIDTVKENIERQYKKDNNISEPLARKQSKSNNVVKLKKTESQEIKEKRKRFFAYFDGHYQDYLRKHNLPVEGYYKTPADHTVAKQHNIYDRYSIEQLKKAVDIWFSIPDNKREYYQLTVKALASKIQTVLLMAPKKPKEVRKLW